MVGLEGWKGVCEERSQMRLHSLPQRRIPDGQSRFHSHTLSLAKSTVTAYQSLPGNGSKFDCQANQDYADLQEQLLI